MLWCFYGGLVLDCFPHGSEVVHGGILAAFIFTPQSSSDQTGRVPILRFVGRPHRCSMGQIRYDMAPGWRCQTAVQLHPAPKLITLKIFESLDIDSSVCGLRFPMFPWNDLHLVVTKDVYQAVLNCFQTPWICIIHLKYILKYHKVTYVIISHPFSSPDWEMAFKSPSSEASLWRPETASALCSESLPASRNAEGRRSCTLL